MRATAGKSSRRKHKKILTATKGYRMSKNKLYKVAHEAYMHAGQYAYADRQKRQAQIRKLWIQRVNAAARLNGISYGKFIDGLKKAQIELDRRILSDIALNNPNVFTAITKEI